MSTTDTLNGHAKGRAVPALPRHTFQDSGVTVKLHKLSPMTSQEIMAAVQRERAADKPQPPIVEVDYGNGKVSEPHEGHPIYQEKLKRWQSECNTEANKRLFTLACLDAVEFDLTDDIRQQIERKKRHLKIAAKLTIETDPDLSDEENDRVFFITHIACASPDDTQEFYEAIALRSQPTEAAIEQHKQSFPSDV